MAHDTISIIGGPGKFELMLALFEGKEISFTLEEVGVVKVTIGTIQAEDGSHESWNLNGWHTNQQLQKFHAYYTTRGNRGTVRTDQPLVAV